MNIEISRFWQRLQLTLFPEFGETLEPATEKHREIALILDLVRVEDFVGNRFIHSGPGRPQTDRQPLVRAFIAKAVLNLPTTRCLIERLEFDGTLRRMCGWIFRHEVPCEATFSNAFREFAESQRFSAAHAAMIERHLGETLVFHLNRDSTAIEAREAHAKKVPKEKGQKFGRGRPKQGEVRPEKEVKRVDKQFHQTLEEMMNELPTLCDSGAKTNSKGHPVYWNGYKLHLDVSDGGVPIAAILTSASVHDSQVAIPLEEMSSKRVTSLYTLADAAYVGSIIEKFIEGKGKVSIVDIKKKRGETEAKEMEPCKRIRYKNRTTVERTYSDIKDNHGGRTIRVKGAAKVMAHLMAAVLVVTAKMLLPLL